ncbi:MAG TPA: alpha/beta fold hydrolase [Actinomycetota bacterium]
MSPIRSPRSGPRPAVVHGCEPFRSEGGPVGVWLQHGFTGCPASMRPFGMWLAERGLTVVVPRLPGHGTSPEDLAATSWEDWDGEAGQAVDELAARCSTVIAVGLSFGATLALHQAATRPDAIAGVVAINGYIHDSRLLMAFAARAFMRTRKGTGRDIKKPGVEELNYERMPVSVLPGLGKYLRMVERELPDLRQPLLLFSSDEDHTSKPANSRLIMAKAGSPSKELIRLTNSYHVATMDYDAESIFERVLAFAHSLAAGERTHST